MNENEFDRTARAWLEDGPTRMSDRAVLSALEEIHTTQQRRPWWPARRATPVNLFVRAAIAAVLVVGIGLVAVNVLPRQPDGSGVGGEPTASPASSASPAQSAGIPELTETFVSTVNGFSIGYPDDATVDPTTVSWNVDVEQDNEQFDFILAEAYSLRGASTEIPDGVSIDDWVDREIVGYQPGSCGNPRSEQLEITIDGQAGRVWEGCPGEVEATIVADGRLYLFTLFGDGASRAAFDTYAATIDLRPEEAAVPSASPSS
jgi:hypothetical protein